MKTIKNTTDINKNKDIIIKKMQLDFVDKTIGEFFDKKFENKQKIEEIGDVKLSDQRKTQLIKERKTEENDFRKHFPKKEAKYDKSLPEDVFEKLNSGVSCRYEDICKKGINDIEDVYSNNYINLERQVLKNLITDIQKASKIEKNILNELEKLLKSNISKSNNNKIKQLLIDKSLIGEDFLNVFLETRLSDSVVGFNLFLNDIDKEIKNNTMLYKPKTYQLDLIGDIKQMVNKELMENNEDYVYMQNNFEIKQNINSIKIDIEDFSKDNFLQNRIEYLENIIGDNNKSIEERKDRLKELQKNNTDIRNALYGKYPDNLEIAISGIDENNIDSDFIKDDEDLIGFFKERLAILKKFAEKKKEYNNEFVKETSKIIDELSCKSIDNDDKFIDKFLKKENRDCEEIYYQVKKMFDNQEDIKKFKNEVDKKITQGLNDFIQKKSIKSTIKNVISLQSFGDEKSLQKYYNFLFDFITDALEKKQQWKKYKKEIVDFYIHNKKELLLKEGCTEFNKVSSIFFNHFANTDYQDYFNEFFNLFVCNELSNFNKSLKCFSNPKSSINTITDFEKENEVWQDQSYTRLLKHLNDHFSNDKYKSGIGYSKLILKVPLEKETKKIDKNVIVAVTNKTTSLRQEKKDRMNNILIQKGGKKVLPINDSAINFLQKLGLSVYLTGCKEDGDIKIDNGIILDLISFNKDQIAKIKDKQYINNYFKNLKKEEVDGVAEKIADKIIDALHNAMEKNAFWISKGTTTDIDEFKKQNNEEKKLFLKEQQQQLVLNHQNNLHKLTQIATSKDELFEKQISLLEKKINQLQGNNTNDNIESDNEIKQYELQIDKLIKMAKTFDKIAEKNDFYKEIIDYYSKQKELCAFFAKLKQNENVKKISFTKIIIFYLKQLKLILTQIRQQMEQTLFNRGFYKKMNNCDRDDVPSIMQTIDGVLFNNNYSDMIIAETIINELFSVNGKTLAKHFYKIYGTKYNNSLIYKKLDVIENILDGINSSKEKQDILDKIIRIKLNKQDNSNISKDIEDIFSVLEDLLKKQSKIDIFSKYKVENFIDYIYKCFTLNFNLIKDNNIDNFFTSQDPNCNQMLNFDTFINGLYIFGKNGCFNFLKNYNLQTFKQEDNSIIKNHRLYFYDIKTYDMKKQDGRMTEEVRQVINFFTSFNEDDYKYKQLDETCIDFYIQCLIANGFLKMNQPSPFFSDYFSNNAGNNNIKFNQEPTADDYIKILKFITFKCRHNSLKQQYEYLRNIKDYISSCIQNKLYNDGRNGCYKICDKQYNADEFYKKTYSVIEKFLNQMNNEIEDIDYKLNNDFAEFNSTIDIDVNKINDQHAYANNLLIDNNHIELFKQSFTTNDLEKQINKIKKELEDLLNVYKKSKDILNVIGADNIKEVDVLNNNFFKQDKQKQNNINNIKINENFLEKDEKDIDKILEKYSKKNKTYSAADSIKQDLKNIFNITDELGTEKCFESISKNNLYKQCTTINKTFIALKNICYKYRMKKDQLKAREDEVGSKMMYFLEEGLLENNATAKRNSLTELFNSIAEIFGQQAGVSFEKKANSIKPYLKNMIKFNINNIIKSKDEYKIKEEMDKSIDLIIDTVGIKTSKSDIQKQYNEVCKNVFYNEKIDFIKLNKEYDKITAELSTQPSDSEEAAEVKKLKEKGKFDSYTKDQSIISSYLLASGDKQLKRYRENIMQDASRIGALTGEEVEKLSVSGLNFTKVSTNPLGHRSDNTLEYNTNIDAFDKLMVNLITVDDHRYNFMYILGDDGKPISIPQFDFDYTDPTIPFDMYSKHNEDIKDRFSFLRQKISNIFNSYMPILATKKAVKEFAETILFKDIKPEHLCTIIKYRVDRTHKQSPVNKSDLRDILNKHILNVCNLIYHIEQAMIAEKKGKRDENKIKKVYLGKNCKFINYDGKEVSVLRFKNQKEDEYFSYSIENNDNNIKELFDIFKKAIDILVENIKECVDFRDNKLDEFLERYNENQNKELEKKNKSKLLEKVKKNDIYTINKDGKERTYVENDNEYYECINNKKDKKKEFVYLEYSKNKETIELIEKAIKGRDTMFSDDKIITLKIDGEEKDFVLYLDNYFYAKKTKDKNGNNKIQWLLYFDYQKIHKKIQEELSKDFENDNFTINLEGIKYDVVYKYDKYWIRESGKNDDFKNTNNSNIIATINEHIAYKILQDKNSVCFDKYVQEHDGKKIKKEFIYGKTLGRYFEIIQSGSSCNKNIIDKSVFDKKKQYFSNLIEIGTQTDDRWRLFQIGNKFYVKEPERQTFKIATKNLMKNYFNQITSDDKIQNITIQSLQDGDKNYKTSSFIRVGKKNIGYSFDQDGDSEDLLLKNDELNNFLDPKNNNGEYCYINNKIYQKKDNTFTELNKQQIAEVFNNNDNTLRIKKDDGNEDDYLKFGEKWLSIVTGQDFKVENNEHKIELIQQLERIMQDVNYKESVKELDGLYLYKIYYKNNKGINKKLLLYKDKNEKDKNTLYKNNNLILNKIKQLCKKSNIDKQNCFTFIDKDGVEKNLFKINENDYLFIFNDEIYEREKEFIDENEGVLNQLYYKDNNCEKISYDGILMYNLECNSEIKHRENKFYFKDKDNVFKPVEDGLCYRYLNNNSGEIVAQYEDNDKNNNVIKKINDKYYHYCYNKENKIKFVRTYNEEEFEEYLQPKNIFTLDDKQIYKIGDELLIYEKDWKYKTLNDDILLKMVKNNNNCSFPYICKNGEKITGNYCGFGDCDDENKIWLFITNNEKGNIIKHNDGKKAKIVDYELVYARLNNKLLLNNKKLVKALKKEKQLKIEKQNKILKEELRLKEKKLKIRFNGDVKIKKNDNDTYKQREMIVKKEYEEFKERQNLLEEARNKRIKEIVDKKNRYKEEIKNSIECNKEKQQEYNKNIVKMVKNNRKIYKEPCFLPKIKNNKIKNYNYDNKIQNGYNKQKYKISYNSAQFGKFNGNYAML